MRSSADVRADLSSPISTLAALLRREGLSEPDVEQALAELFGISDEGPKRELRRILASVRFAQELRLELFETEPVETEWPGKADRHTGGGPTEGSRTLEYREWPKPAGKPQALQSSDRDAFEAPSSWSCGKTAGGVQIVQDFLSRVSQATAAAEVGTLLEEAAASLGFDYYILVYPQYLQQRIGRTWLTNMPSVWLGEPQAGDVWNHPFLRRVEQTCSAFRWADLHKLLVLTSDEQEFLRQMARRAIVQGISIPQHVPGEIYGSCHFLLQGKRAFPDASVAAAQAVGAFAFEAVRRFAGTEAAGNALESAPLSQRQRECLLWVARGKSDNVIAELLSIKPRTVSEHIEAAKRRYAVATRSQLLVRALFRSEVRFAEVLDAHPRPAEGTSIAAPEWQNRVNRAEVPDGSPESKLERLAVSLAGVAELDSWLAALPAAEGYAADD